VVELITVETRNGIALVSMKPYKPRVVEAIRTIRGKRWDEKNKRWSIPMFPIGALERSLQRLARTGEMIVLNGVEWEGTDDTKRLVEADRIAKVAAENAGNPFIALWAALPDRLRQPVYDALFPVLAPGAGGDAELLVMLDQAHNPEGAEQKDASQEGRRLVRRAAS
jgi:hypothetical protein